MMMTTPIILHKQEEVMTRNPLTAMVFASLLLVAPWRAAAAPLRIQATAAAPGSAILELQADELVTMTVIPFCLQISDAAGKPLTGAKVNCDMTMPSMPMPENRPKVVERDGGYCGELIFTCAMGAWRIGCVAEKADGSRQTMTFDIDKVRMK
jgi:hypothetical protein